jgi:hypothetical protein
VSVIFFDAEELGNVARVLSPGASSYDERVFRNYCEALAHYSAANAAAYRQTYRDEQDTRGHTADEIAHAAPGPVSMSLPKAVQTVRLLHYNAIANDGRDFAEESIEAMRALTLVSEGLLGDVVRRLESAEARVKAAEERADRMARNADRAERRAAVVRERGR